MRPDAADDWIAERITSADICVTADIPLASRCLAKDARAIAPNGKIWTKGNIGQALAGRELSRHLRELGVGGGGPPPFSKSDRSRFLSALDTELQALLRQSAAKGCGRLSPSARFEAGEPWSCAAMSESPRKARNCRPYRLGHRHELPGLARFQSAG